MSCEGRTDRLILRPLEIADAPRIQEFFPHWKVVRYLQNRVPWPIRRTVRSSIAGRLRCCRWSVAKPGIGPCGWQFSRQG